ncbi:MAG: dehydrogenase [Gammaproteobacteria bacterium]|nr:MAG: dehydrogenase [Gammaproteobacteria bacterium]
MNFREELDQALRINTLCLLELIELAERGHDTAFVQVSTCYVHGYHSGDIAEQNHAPAKGGIPRHPDGYYEVEPLIDQYRMEIDRIYAQADESKRAEALIRLGARHAQAHGWNDVYTLTKWMGEQLLYKYRRGKSLAVVRPAIVESAWQEPMPGWVEGVKVADAVILAYARQKVSLFPGRRAGIIDVIPVDLVANSIIMAAAETQIAAPDHRIYQCCSGETNPITLGQFIDLLQEEGLNHYYKYDRLFFQKPEKLFRTVPRWLFGLIMRSGFAAVRGWAAVSRLVGRSGSTRAMEVFRTTLNLALVFSFYTVPNYRFSNARLRALAERMGDADRELFPVDAAVFDWKVWLQDIHMAGLNRYALRPKPARQTGRKRRRHAAPAASETASETA